MKNQTLVQEVDGKQESWDIKPMSTRPNPLRKFVVLQSVYGDVLDKGVYKIISRDEFSWDDDNWLKQESFDTREEAVAYIYRWKDAL